jgi:hypothetical protein
MKCDLNHNDNDVIWGLILKTSESVKAVSAGLPL